MKSEGHLLPLPIIVVYQIRFCDVLARQVSHVSERRVLHSYWLEDFPRHQLLPGVAPYDFRHVADQAVHEVVVYKTRPYITWRFQEPDLSVK